MHQKCPQHTTEYHDRFRAPSFSKFQVSGIKPRQKITGEYHGTPPANAQLKQLWCLEEKCNKVYHTSLRPVDRSVHSPKSKGAQFKPNELCDCFVDQPNKFLKDLPNQYPELYTKLRGMQHMQTVCESGVRRTTIQIDFGPAPEYPTGPYPQPRHRPTLEWQLVDPCRKDLCDKKLFGETPNRKEMSARALSWKELSQKELPEKELCAKHTSEKGGIVTDTRKQIGHFPELFPRVFPPSGSSRLTCG